MPGELGHGLIAERGSHRAVAHLISSTCGFGIAGRNPSSLCFLELLFALSIRKLFQSRLIGFVEVGIGSRKMFAGSRIHLRLRLPVNLRKRNQQGNKQSRALREYSHRKQRPPTHPTVQRACHVDERDQRLMLPSWLRAFGRCDRLIFGRLVLKFAARDRTTNSRVSLIEA